MKTHEQERCQLVMQSAWRMARELSIMIGSAYHDPQEFFEEAARRSAQAKKEYTKQAMRESQNAVKQ